MFLIAEADRTVDVGAIFESALLACGMSHKEAAICMFGSPDTARLHKAIVGELSLDDWRIVRLPWRFQAEYETRRISAVFAYFAEGFQPVPAKAELREKRTKEIA